MTAEPQRTFIIAREDRAEDPKTVVSDGLRIGRLPDSDIWLNHPTVSRLHAGISEIEGCFYIINLSASSATTLNGRVIPFNEAEALTAGDEIQIGPYFLDIEEEANETLRIRVVAQFALKVGERVTRHTGELYQKQLALKSRITGSSGEADAQDVIKQTGGLIPDSSELANALKVFWDKRTREKAGRPSPLHPRRPPRLGKARFNWTPTRDLVRPWPFAIFIWALIVVGALSALAAVKYRIAFAPKLLSAPHMRTALTLSPAIATRPNGSSCTSCHALGVSMANKERMNSNCAVCHQTEAFAASIIRAHREAGITCTSCHSEHRGDSFRPISAGLESCVHCHNDENRSVYNGKSVHTPHGGTYGYPVVNGRWVWQGLEPEELALKPELVTLLKKNRVSDNQTQEWRNAQFHAVHLKGIRVVVGIDGIEDGEGNKVMSCSSCHRSGYMASNVDRTYPRTTCALCHNTRVFQELSRSQGGIETPSCVSCHVQHAKDAHWPPSSLTSNSRVPDTLH